MRPNSRGTKTKNKETVAVPCSLGNLLVVGRGCCFVVGWTVGLGFAVAGGSGFGVGLGIRSTGIN